MLLFSRMIVHHINMVYLFGQVFCLFFKGQKGINVFNVIWEFHRMEPLYSRLCVNCLILEPEMLWLADLYYPNKCHDPFVYR